MSRCASRATGDEPGDGVTQIALGSRPIARSGGVDPHRGAPASLPGTAHRLDGVPLTLQAPEPGDAPTAAALLARLLEEIER